MTIHLEPVTAEFVAVARGIDLSKPLDAQSMAEVVGALDKYAVVVFPDQPLSQDELVALARQFGPLDSDLQEKVLNHVQTRLKYNTISDISNVDESGKVADRDHKQSILNVGNQFWHSDSSYTHAPWRYSMLHSIHAVSRGGATEYADLRAAYDTLDQDLKELIADKIGVFYSHHTRRWLGIEDTAHDLAAYPPVKWPLVRRHPGSGRQLLWVDNKVTDIVGMPVHEARALVHELLEHIGQREHVYAHYWKAGDLVIYDNRSCLHRGRRFDLTERREMRRISVVETQEFSLGEESRPEKVV